MSGARFVQREKKYLLGDEYMDVDIHAAWHTPMGRGRSARQKESCPAQKDLNEKRSKQYFVRLVMNNFGEGDFRLDLTYNEEHKPASAEELIRSGRNLIRRLKNVYKKAGLTMRYVMVNAWGESKQTGKVVRPHHHLIVSGGLTLGEVMSAWRTRTGESRGYVAYSPLQPDKDTGIVGLATYLAEQPSVGARRWTSSQGLAVPEYSVNDSRYSKRSVAKLVMMECERAYGAGCAKLLNYGEWNKKYPGYRLVGYDPHWQQDIGAWSVSLRFKRVG